MTVFCRVRTFKMKLSSGWSFRSSAAPLIAFSNSKSLFLGTSNEGNKSPINPINTGKSSVTILGMLKSRRALIRTWSSGRNLSPLWKTMFTKFSLQILLQAIYRVREIRKQESKRKKDAYDIHKMQQQMFRHVRN